jgi:hypothetical protein
MKAFTPFWFFVSWVFVGAVTFFVLRHELDQCSLQSGSYSQQTAKHEQAGQDRKKQDTRGASLPEGNQRDASAAKVGERSEYEFCGLKFSDLLVLMSAYLTLGVALLQIFYLHGTLDATSKNAQAAKDQADAAVKAQAPILLPFIYRASLLPRGPERPFTPSLMYVWENHGRTPAIIIALKCELILVDTLPAKRTWQQPDERPDREVIPGDTRSASIATAMPYTFHRALTEEEIADLRKQEAPFKRYYFYGEITYDDVFGYRHVRGFCRKVFPAGPSEIPKQPVRGYEGLVYEYYERYDRRTMKRA